MRNWGGLDGRREMVEEVTWEDTWTNLGAVEFGVYESHISYF